MYYNLQKISGENGIIFISTIFSAPQILRKCYWNKKRTAVALQGQIEKIGQQNLENELLKLKRGESRKMQHEDVMAVAWQDKRVVLLLSTNSDPRSYGSVTQKTGKGNEENEIACPQAIINYTKHMGGVDVSDQRREYCGVGRSSKYGGNLYYILS